MGFFNRLFQDYKQESDKIRRIRKSRHPKSVIKQQVKIMDGSIPNEFVDEVRLRFDIVDIVSEYVQLKKSGRNYFGLCPFHSEKTPSFSVAQDKQIFHCFGCGEGGNVFSFIMKMDGLAFPEAVRELANRAGMTLPHVENSIVERQKIRKKDRLREASELASRFYQHHLQHPQPAGAAAREYLHKRGLSADVIERFALGFAPDKWDGLKLFLQKKGFKEQELIEAGLLTDKAYDRFRNRIIFPIWDQRGTVIAFGGRIMGDGMPKYLNSPETALFDKGRNLYALHLARETIRKEKRAIIFEGYMDVIAAHQASLTNAVASLGTSLTEAQARLLRNQAEEVVIVYDADAAGQAATWRGLQTLRQAGCLVKVGRLPLGQDPDDFIRARGGDVFRSEVIEKALLLVDYQLVSLTEKYNMDNDGDRIRCSEQVIDVLAAVQNTMERESYMEKAAEILRIPPGAIREELKKKAQQSIRSPFRPQTNNVNKTEIQTDPIQDKMAVQILALWSRFPSLVQRYASELSEDDFIEGLRPLFAEILKGGEAFSPARLYDLLPEGKHRQLLSTLLINEQYEENVAQKAVDDCVRRLKCVRIIRQRKELEAKMAVLDPASAKGEFSELSKKWHELRELEEILNKPREGGKSVG
jgi:DNA primase